MPADLPDDPDQLAELLRPALLRVARRLRQEASKAGLSALDVLLLVEIKRQPGVGVSDLADAEQMSRPAMSTRSPPPTGSCLMAKASSAAKAACAKAASACASAGAPITNVNETSAAQQAARLRRAFMADSSAFDGFAASSNFM